MLVIGDERVRQVSQFEPGRSSLREIEFQGGGGTDFTPMLEEAARHHPDTVIVLTDLDGPARFSPRCPVIWAVPEAACRGRRALRPQARAALSRAAAITRQVMAATRGLRYRAADAKHPTRRRAAA